MTDYTEALKRADHVKTHSLRMTRDVCGICDAQKLRSDLAKDVIELVAEVERQNNYLLENDKRINELCNSLGQLMKERQELEVERNNAYQDNQKLIEALNKVHKHSGMTLIAKAEYEGSGAFKVTKRSEHCEQCGLALSEIEERYSQPGGIQ